LRANLTRKGREVLAACDKATAHVERTLLSELTANQVDTLRSMLETCANSLVEDSRGPRNDD
jgi:DNA-binding MarR family transcriptional regulator